MNPNSRISLSQVKDMCKENPNTYLLITPNVSRSTILWCSDFKKRVRVLTFAINNKLIKGEIQLEDVIGNVTIENCVYIALQGTISETMQIPDKRVYICTLSKIRDLTPELATIILDRITLSGRVCGNSIQTHVKNLPDSYNEIIPGLFLGAKSAYQNLPKGVTHVVSVTHTVNAPPEGIYKENFYHINIYDKANVDIYKHFNEATDFIQHGLEQGGKVLVHCEAGVSRSCTIVCAYLIRYHNMSYQDSLAKVKKHRPCVDPNIGFHGSLQMYSRELKRKEC